jgi:hypothetical protein
LGLPWTPEEIALVGVLADAEVARRTGRTVNAVRLMRQRLGRPDPTRPPRPLAVRWVAEHDELLRRLPPQQVVERTGHPLRSVYQRRHELGIR